MKMILFNHNFGMGPCSGLSHTLFKYRIPLIWDQIIWSGPQTIAPYDVSFTLL